MLRIYLLAIARQKANFLHSLFASGLRYAQNDVE